ncbi:MAG: hypothetical protein CMJ58_09715 [Planctomycetaceae bacterium]|nr:hypothetical protein [Planctomycetaceae bacterium]
MLIAEPTISLDDLFDADHALDARPSFTSMTDAIAALRAAEERADWLQMVIDTGNDAYVSMSITGEILAWNKRAAELFGWTAAEVIGERLANTILPPANANDGVCRVKQLVAIQGAGKRVEIEATTRDGRKLPVEVSIAPMRRGSSFVMNAFIHDISARRELQAQLTHAQRMESVGQLSAGIAHEINTPTQYVGDNARFLGESFRDLLDVLQAYGALADAVRGGQDAQAALTNVEDAIEAAELDYLTDEIELAIQQSLEGVHRVASIVRAMKEFSHPGTVEKKPTNLNACVRNTVTVATNEWKYVATVEFDLDEHLPLTPCLPGDLNQVVLNLIVNAAQAIAEKVGPSPKVKGVIGVATRQADGGVEIEISDTGAGIPQDLQRRIFDPFFTTKDIGVGSGQGLAIARSVVVDKHAGRIDFESALGQGTRFVLWLPLPA